MAIIEYEIVGDSNFLRAAEYRTDLSTFVKVFETKFLLAENVTIQFEESINPDPNKAVPNKLMVSDDGTSINLIYKSSRFFEGKGVMSKPSVSAFFSGLKFYIENTVIASDHKRFKLLNNNQEEE